MALQPRLPPCHPAGPPSLLSEPLARAAPCARKELAHLSPGRFLLIHQASSPLGRFPSEAGSSGCIFPAPYVAPRGSPWHLGGDFWGPQLFTSLSFWKTGSWLSMLPRRPPRCVWHPWRWEVGPGAAGTGEPGAGAGVEGHQCPAQGHACAAGQARAWWSLSPLPCCPLRGRGWRCFLCAPHSRPVTLSEAECTHPRGSSNRQHLLDRDASQ